MKLPRVVVGVLDWLGALLVNRAVDRLDPNERRPPRLSAKWQKSKLERQREERRRRGR